MGPYGGYAANIAIAMLRLGLERGSKTQHTITCGTHVETAIYLALDGMLKQQYGPTQPFKEAAMERSEVSMRFLGFLMADSGPYDALFYLPVTEVPEGEGWIGKLDENIPQALELYGVPATTLEGTAEECVEAATKVIEEVQTKSTEEENT